MGQLVLETVTCVTVASYNMPRGPVEESPMATLTPGGAEDTRGLRNRLANIKGTAPFDCAFSAVPTPMVAAVGEMVINLTGDERTGLADLPYMNHPLFIHELGGVRQVEAFGATSLMSIMMSSDKANVSFLQNYALDRKERLLDFVEMNEARHILVLGLPIFLQAIAYWFAKGESGKRAIEAASSKPCSVVQVDYQTGSVRVLEKLSAH